jgi:aminopeptidase N
MKHLNFLLSMSFLLMVTTSYAQHDHSQCNHKMGFDRSLISDTLDAISYEIHLTEVNTSDQTIEAHTKIILASKVDGLNQITLELLDLTVDQVLVNGVINDFTQENPFLYIPLSNPINTGDEVEVEVFYQGSPFHERWGGFHWNGEYAFNLGVGFESDPHNLGKAWFPCIDDFHDRAFYEVFVTAENPKKGVCGGTLMEVIDNGNGTSTWHWKLHLEIPTYLASVAVGEYEEVSWSFTSMSGDEIPINIFVRPADTAKVEGSFATLVEVLDAFESSFGPYAWERVGYVGTAIGAMEHATNIAYPNFSINGNLAYESLMAHELSHMYFGDLVTCASAQDMWLNEGWAVFCEARYREVLYGYDAYHSNMYDRHRDVLHTGHVTDGGYYAVSGIPTEITYGNTVYQKGALMVHTLRNYMGDDLFFPAVKAYVQEYYNNYASSMDLRDFLSSHSGMDLNGFFDAWIFTPGFPEYSVDSFNVVPNGNNFDVTVFAKQKHKGPGELGDDIRVEVTLMDEAWNQETFVMEYSGETGQQTFTTSINPEIVMMDINDKVADATTDRVITPSGPFNNSFSTELYCSLGAEEFPADDSAYIRITHRWVAPDPIKNPIPGITISDYRHWRIDGILPDGLQLNGKLNYSANGNLDGGILTDPNDSIGILYRPNRFADWQPIEASRIGSFYVGFFTLPDMPLGEYTLAVWDDVYVGIEDEQAPVVSEGQEVKMFPNPAGDEISIILGQRNATNIQVFDSSGKLVDEMSNQQKLKGLRYDSSKLENGTYIFKFMDQNGREIESHKIVIN